MNIYIIIAILAVHWLADFLLQTDWQAQNKSSNIKALLEHTVTYSWVWFFVVLFYLIIQYNAFEFYKILICVFVSIYFTITTFICHTITDYFTSRLNKKLWEEKKVHWFFVSIGFDQLLHYIQLLITYKLIFM